MDTSVYIFSICLDIFIVFTVFSLYFYVLFRYYMHIFEETALVKFLVMHLEPYKPIIKLIKLSSKIKAEPNLIPDLINKSIKNVIEHESETDYTIGNIMLITGIVGLFTIVAVLFYIYYDKIIEQISLTEVIFTVVINTVLIIGCELIFLFIVYGNSDFFNLAKLFNIII